MPSTMATARAAGRPALPGPLWSYAIALIAGTGPCGCMISTAEPPLAHSLDATVLNSALINCALTELHHCCPLPLCVTRPRDKTAAVGGGICKIEVGSWPAARHNPTMRSRCHRIDGPLEPRGPPAPHPAAAAAAAAGARVKQDRNLQGDVDATVVLMMKGKQWRNLLPNLEQTCRSGRYSCANVSAPTARVAGRCKRASRLGGGDIAHGHR